MILSLFSGFPTVTTANTGLELHFQLPRKFLSIVLSVCVVSRRWLVRWSDHRSPSVVFVYPPESWNTVYGVWVGFSGGFSLIPCHKFHSTFSPHSSHSFHFIRPCDGVSGVIGRHPCYSLTFNKGALSHLIPWPSPVSKRVEVIYLLNKLHVTH